MKRSKSKIMEGVESTKSKIVANNTVEYFRPNGVRVIRLHNTDILEFPVRGGVIFNSGGWKTVTTKARMNEFQNEATIYQEKGLWYVIGRVEHAPYFDGIKIKDGKVVNAKTSVHKKEQDLLKKIKTYCDELRTLPELPVPSSSDCWYCSFQTEDDKTMGDLSGSDHLLNHLDEKYIHGSLIFNALKNSGYSDPRYIFSMDIRDSIVNSVRKYFKSKLGLVC